MPAPSASELAIKLRLYPDAYGWGSSRQRAAGEQITIDARRFGRHGAHLETDEALLHAFAGRRREYEATRKFEMTRDEDDAYFDRCDALEEVLYSTPATTIDGVLAKLRIAFLHQTGEAWSDLAICDPSAPLFSDGLRMADVYTRLAWSAVTDLARIGGVSLKEQGA